MNGQKGLSWLLFVLLALIWGSSFILIKISTHQLDGWQIGAVRVFSAAILFLPPALFHIGKLPKNKILIIILSGILGNLLPAFLFGLAIQKIESSVAGILNSLTPLFVIIIGALFFHVKIQSRKLIGVAIGFIGMLVLSVSKGPVFVSELSYTLMILLATILYGFNVNIVGTYLKGLDPVKMATVSIAFLIVPTSIVLWLHPVSLATEEEKRSVLAAVSLGILGSAAATIIFYTLIKKAGGLFASLVTYAIPIVAMFWGFLAKENVGLIQLGCLGIILVGVYLANRS